MADVFINSSREDRELARALETGLEARGLTVWSDRDLEPGAGFVEAIQSAMSDAGCILTLWSSHSVSSSWVKAEAQWALKSGTLLPVAVGPDVEIPPPFLTVQTRFATAAQLHQDEWIEQLADDVRRMARAGASKPVAPAPAAAPVQSVISRRPAEALPTDDRGKRKKAFISYAEEDEQTAIDLVQHLEAAGCPCWISFRDVDAGEDYRGSITKAMDEIVFLVLVYTTYVNTSFDIATELLLARKRGRKRLVLRMDPTEPSGPVEYELATVQWIDCQRDRQAGFERVSRRAALL